MKRNITKVIVLLIILSMTIFTGCSGNASDNDISASGDNAQPSGNGVSVNGEAQSDQEDDGENLDKYQTAEVPEGKPDPVEPQKIDVNKKEAYHCTISISCNTILNNMDKFDQSKLEVLPDDGIITAAAEVEFYEGENVFDVLLRATKDKGIHMEFVSTPIYNSNYIEGINNIYEFDCGELSGWMYKVNDWFPNYGSSRYMLNDGDKVEWVYTCDLGRDVGGDWSTQNAGRE